MYENGDVPIKAVMCCFRLRLAMSSFAFFSITAFFLYSMVLSSQPNKDNAYSMWAIPGVILSGMLAPCLGYCWLNHLVDYRLASRTLQSDRRDSISSVPIGTVTRA